MSNPQIDTRAEIEEAFKEFDIFLAAGLYVWNMEPASRDAITTLNTVIEEFELVKARVLAA